MLRVDPSSVQAFDPLHWAPESRSHGCAQLSLSDIISSRQLLPTHPLSPQLSETKQRHSTLAGSRLLSPGRQGQPRTSPPSCRTQLPVPALQKLTRPSSACPHSSSILQATPTPRTSTMAEVSSALSIPAVATGLDPSATAASAGAGGGRGGGRGGAGASAAGSGAASSSSAAGGGGGRGAASASASAAAAASGVSGASGGASGGAGAAASLTSAPVGLAPAPAGSPASSPTGSVAVGTAAASVPPPPSPAGKAVEVSGWSVLVVVLGGVAAGLAAV